MTTTAQAPRSLVDLDVVRIHHRDAERVRTPAAVWVAIADLPVLVEEIHRLRSLPILTRTHYVNLLAAARAAVAADRDGEPDPLLYLRDELHPYAQMPPRGHLPHDLLASSDPTTFGEPR